MFHRLRPAVLADEEQSFPRYFARARASSMEPGKLFIDGADNDLKITIASHLSPDGHRRSGSGFGLVVLKRARARAADVCESPS